MLVAVGFPALSLFERVFLPFLLGLLDLRDRNLVGIYN